MSEEAFKQHILPMKDKLFRFAYRFLQDVQEAEDAVQDVMAGVWARRAEWLQWKSIPAYCMTATRNNCLDRLRRRTTTTIREGAAAEISSPDRDPYEKVTNKEMMRRIQECIDDLPPQQQHVIRLREMEGFSYNEIAEVLDMTLDQVKVNLFRGRSAIRKTIIKEEEIWKRQP
ncbi:MAG TPA: sigma-70 family RNA polymerase sigma factor [Puia sp.]|jgi:RNA polymerase sigma-70 factor (ECF subfamily)|nr:sigma-70 family RNA polymerase sigma factor [Puia sp.]